MTHGGDSCCDLQALMREQMRNTDRAFSNIESHPEGFNALRRMYENVQVTPAKLPPQAFAHRCTLRSTCSAQAHGDLGPHGRLTFQEPMMDAMADDAANGAAGGNTRNPFASLVAGLPSSSSAAAASTGAPASTPASTVPNTSPLPNPWAPAGSQPTAGATPVTFSRNLVLGHNQCGVNGPAHCSSLLLAHPDWPQGMWCELTSLLRSLLLAHADWPQAMRCEVISVSVK